MQLTDGHVMTCLADDCSYNRHEMCCAPKVEVGHDHAMCDTYTTEPVSMTEHEARVTGCDISGCHFNRSMACHASGVTMTRHEAHADCATFRA